VVRDGQETCYISLGVADQSGDLTPFLRFMLAAIASACSEIGSEIATACGITAERILKLLAAETRLPAGRVGSAGSGHWQGVVTMGMVGRSGDVMTPSRSPIAAQIDPHLISELKNPNPMSTSGPSCLPGSRPSKPATPAGA
jgi:hypothetical protein